MFKLNKYVNHKAKKFRYNFYQHFKMKESLGHLIHVSNHFYFIFFESNQTKNSKKFKMSLLHLIYYSLFTLNCLMIVISDDFYSLVKIKYLPDQFKLCASLLTIGSIWIIIIRIDLLIIKSNLYPLKIFDFLINNFISKHKLTEFNYNRLAILSRTIQIMVLDYGIPIPLIIALALIISFAILSQKLIWILESIFMIPGFLFLNIKCFLFLNIKCFLFLNIKCFHFLNTRFFNWRFYHCIMDVHCFCRDFIFQIKI